MALNTNLPNWIENSQTDWLRSAAASGASAINRGLELGIRQNQFQQEQALQLRQLMLREQQQTMLNQVRLEQLNEAERQLRDQKKLLDYSKNPDAGIPDLEDPSSFSKLGAIRLAHERSALGRQTIADQTDFNRRLQKISAADRVFIRDLQRQGRPESEQWDALGAAEQRINQTKIFAPDALQKALDSYNAAKDAGNEQEAALWMERAGTIARGGKAPVVKSPTTAKPGEAATKPFNFTGLLTRLFGKKPDATVTTAAGETNVNTIIAQANAAIQAGKDPEAVRKRLKELGVEFDEQTIAPDEIRDALSEQVQGALEAKPISP